VSLTPDEALARAADEGIHRLEIPTPFAVGRVNCYLIDDEPLTLVDTGPNSGKSLDELQRQIEGEGHALEDLRLVVISHQHIDHLGLVEIVAERSGAEVAALDLLAPFVESYGADAERDDRFAAEVMLRYGIPEDLVTALRGVSASFRAWGASARVTRRLSDGETLALRDRDLEVQHRPGHSPSDTVFWDARRRILISADHLIANISSNPLLARPLDRSDSAAQAERDSVDASQERPKALITYLHSLARTRELPAEIVLPGHGDPVVDHASLIDERFELHRRRAKRLRALIAERPRTAYELAQELWGNVAVTQAFLTLSEVVGHVDLLVAAGVVREAAAGDVITFEATGLDAEVTIPG
jgi:glyoxylase-like metal-dependent hydrolase (beta-lactamase superfamily II)